MTSAAPAPATAPARVGILGPVLTFLVVASAVSAGLEAAVLSLPPGDPGAGDASYSLPQLGPAMGAVATWAAYRRRWRALAPRAVSRERFSTELAFAGVLSLVFAAVLAVGFRLGGDDLAGVLDVGGSPAVVVLGVTYAGALAEEVGWRGVLQPLLEKRFHVGVASGITGLIWSLWHAPVLLEGVEIAVLFIASTTALGVLLGLLTSGTWWQRALTAAVVHALVNLAILLVSGLSTSVDELRPELFASLVSLGLWLLARRWLSRRGDGGS